MSLRGCDRIFAGTWASEICQVVAPRSVGANHPAVGYSAQEVSAAFGRIMRGRQQGATRGPIELGDLIAVLRRIRLESLEASDAPQLAPETEHSRQEAQEKALRQRRETVRKARELADKLNAKMRGRG